MMKSGPFKPEPHEYTGYFVSSHDAMRWASELMKAAYLLKNEMRLAHTADTIRDIAIELALVKELPSKEEQTLKAKARLYRDQYPDISAVNEVAVIEPVKIRIVENG